MKKFLFTVCALVLGLTSCTQKELTPVTTAGEEVAVCFTAALQGADAATRAYSDGTTARVLNYFVYDEDNNSSYLKQVSSQATFPANSLSTTVTLNLVSGKHYSIVFWADAKGIDTDGTAQNDNPYSYNPANKELTVNYAGAKAQDETRDAFYAYMTEFEVTGAMNGNITLKRPFAQINIGTSDLEEAEKSNIAPSVSSMTVTGVSNVINLSNGEVSEPMRTPVTFGAAPIKEENAEEESFPVEPETYKYLGMNYVLVGAENKSLVDVTFDCGTPNPMTFSQIPVQGNYRTNVYGALLTDPTTFTVTIDNRYGEGNDQNHNEPQWDGTTTPVEPEDPDAQIPVYEIATASELAWIAETVNAGNLQDPKAPYIVKLTADINLNNLPWTPIGTNATDKDHNNMNWFYGTFDGQGHTISKLKCSDEGNYAVAGLFGAVRGHIKNVKIDGADIRSTHYAGALVAYAHDNNKALYNGTTYPVDGFVIENCEVTNARIYTTPNLQADGSTYDNGDKAGVLIGYTNTKMTIRNCKVSNSTVEAYRDLGALIGYVGEGATMPIKINNNNASDITLIQNFTNGYKDAAEMVKRHGTWYGWKDSDPAELDGNTESNIVYTAIASGSTSLNAIIKGVQPGVPTTVNVAEGEYSTEDLTFPNGAILTLKGAGADNTFINAEPFKAAHNCELVFEDLSIVVTRMAGTELGFYHTKKCTFKNVTFKGNVFTYSLEGDIYENCTFEPNLDIDNGNNQYAIWCYGGQKTVFNNCTFNNCKAKGILIYNHSDSHPGYDVTVNDCTFNITPVAGVTAASDKGVIEIHTETFLANTKGVVRINNCTFDETLYGGGLWNEVKNGNPPTKSEIFTIIVDGTTVQEGR